MFTRVGQPTSLSCGTVCGGGAWEGTILLAPLSAGFQSLPPLPPVKLGPSGADSHVGGFVCVLGPCQSLQQTFLWGWEFLPPLQPPQIFTDRGFEPLVSYIGILGWAVCLAPQLVLPVYPHANVGPPCPPAAVLPGVLSTPAACLLPSYQSGWMFLL